MCNATQGNTVSVAYWMSIFYVLHLRLFDAIKDLLTYLLSYLLTYCYPNPALRKERSPLLRRTKLEKVRPPRDAQP